MMTLSSTAMQDAAVMSTVRRINDLNSCLAALFVCAAVPLPLHLTVRCACLPMPAVLACCSSTAQAQGQQQQFTSVFMAMLGLPGRPR